MDVSDDEAEAAADALEAQDRSRAAIRARDAIEHIGGREWVAAHQAARAACLETTAAFEDAYRSGELARPYFCSPWVAG